MSGWPLIWKFLLGVAGPGLALTLAWVTIKNNSMPWFWAAFIVAAVWAVMQGVDAWKAWREERAVHEDISVLVEYLVKEIQHAATIEQGIRGDPKADKHFLKYRDEVESWRTKTGGELEARLPRSGASQVFLAALGDTGHGPLYWEYTQLRSCQAALTGILGASDSFVRRSRSLAK